MPEGLKPWSRGRRSVRAMILAAGLGTRLKPLTEEIAKPMVPILNRPVMEHTLELLARHDIRELFVNIHYYPRGHAQPVW